jgi:hypothetical protein
MAFRLSSGLAADFGVHALAHGVHFSQPQSCDFCLEIVGMDRALAAGKERAPAAGRQSESDRPLPAGFRARQRKQKNNAIAFGLMLRFVGSCLI